MNIASLDEMRARKEHRARSHQELTSDLQSACARLGRLAEAWRTGDRNPKSDLTTVDSTILGIYGLLCQLRADGTPNAL